MAYFFFILLTLMYFVRPADWLSALYGLPLYQYALIPCVVFASPRLLDQLNLGTIRKYPITFCVFGLLASVFCSEFLNSGHVFFALEFSKVCLFYLLAVSIIDSPQRFNHFLRTFILILAITGLLVPLSFHGLIDVNAGDFLVKSFDSGPLGALDRPVAIGGKMFDPNDLAMIMVLGTMMSIHVFSVASNLLQRIFWIMPAGIMVYTLWLTQSRGGLIAFMVASAMYVLLRWKKRGVIIFTVVILPIGAAYFGGRMTDISVSEGTGQARIQLWTTGLALFRDNLVVGVGPGRFQEFGRLGCHNSFLQAFAELGFLGGVFFLTASLVAAYIPFRMVALEGVDKTATTKPNDAQLLAIAIAASTVGYGVAMLALNHTYNIATYLVLAISTAYAQQCSAHDRLPNTQINSLLLFRMGAAGVAFVGATYVGTRALVNW